MAKFVINIPGQMLSETSEKLEDTLAIILECLGFEGLINSNVTGNVTLFPVVGTCRGDPGMIDTMIDRLMAKSSTIRCPNCGSSEIFTSEDDQEMRECNECGHLWEIDNANDDS